MGVVKAEKKMEIKECFAQVLPCNSIYRNPLKLGSCVWGGAAGGNCGRPLCLRSGHAGLVIH